MPDSYPPKSRQYKSDQGLGTQTTKGMHVFAESSESANDSTEKIPEISEYRHDPNQGKFPKDKFGNPSCPLSGSEKHNPQLMKLHFRIEKCETWTLTLTFIAVQCAICNQQRFVDSGKLRCTITVYKSLDDSTAKTYTRLKSNWSRPDILVVNSGTQMAVCKLDSIH